MCGILLLSGPNAERRLSGALNRLNHRGPDDVEIQHRGSISMGFVRLAINGTLEQGKQPYSYNNLTAMVNGEIYNHQQLAHKYELPVSMCDSHIILPLYNKLGADLIQELDGFYAGVILDTQKQLAYCLKDGMGKKPLFVGRSENDIFISSELKALETIVWFEALPKGFSVVNLNDGTITLLKPHESYKASGIVTRLLTQSILKRIPADNQPLGLFLSGGLDSSLIASIACRYRDDIMYFTLGSKDNPDYHAVQTVIDHLRLHNVIHVPLPEEKELPALISELVYTTESYNPSIISNGLATWLLARAAHKAGIKVVLTGEGADELFGGYHQFSVSEPWKETREQLINDMQFTELRRLDMACMAHGVEPRCPFLDSDLYAFSNGLDFRQLYSDKENKILLRNQFNGCLPQKILHRQKTSCDVGSGIRGMVVRYLTQNGRSERAELRDIWQHHFKYSPEFSYFHEYPVFDALINKRGTTHK